MRILFTTTIATCALCLGLAQVSFAQDATPVPPAPTTAQPSQPSVSTQPTRIAPGSVIPVQLTKSVDAKKAKTGDTVEAKVTQDMKAQSGQVLMPKDTKIVGHVTEAQGRTKEQKESQLGITFDHAVLKEGGDVPLPASIQAVIAPPSQNPDNAGSGAGGGAPAPSQSGGNSPSAAGSRPGMSGGGSSPQAPSSYPTGGDQSSASAGNGAGTPQITAKAEGVIGISNYKLSTPGDVTQGSVVSSEKSNVKLESGTLMLLRVNQ
jgi:hypothetical protein